MRSFWGACVLAVCVGLLWVKGVAAESWPSLGYPPSDLNADVARAPNDAAVVIGVEDYAFIPDIPGASRNAEDWWRYLQDVRGIPLDRVTLLRNADASAESITDALAAAKTQVQPGGTLWVVFIGHGVPAPDGSDGLLVGVDAQQTARSIQARSLSRQKILDLASSDQHQTVLVLDACFSGQDRQGTALVPGLQPLVLIKDQATQQRALILSAAASDEFAGALPLEQRPAFSYLLLGALRGWGDANGDATVTAAEAITYTRSTLQALLRDRRQTPEVSGNFQAAGPLASGVLERGPNLQPIILALNPAPVVQPIGPDVNGGALVEGIPSPDYVRGSNWTRLFIGAGMPVDYSYVNGTGNSTTSVSGFSRNASTTSTTTSYVTDPEKYAFSLSEHSAAPAVIGGLDATWGRNGFGLVLGGELGWSQPQAVGLITADTFGIGSSEEDKADFASGVKVLLDQMVWLDMSAEFQYRTVFSNKVGLYFQGGAGLRISWLILTNLPTAEQSNLRLQDDMTMTNYTLLLPVRAGVDYNFADDYALNLRYSLLILSSSLIHTAQVGFGLPF